MSYGEKLEGFNATDKYTTEAMFLKLLIDNRNSELDSILDYGCGTGYLVDGLNYSYPDTKIYGYDIEMYNDEFSYVGSVGKHDIVYFMHSFAHIKNIVEVINGLDTMEIIIITPNRSWLFYQNNKNYEPDETVIKHYSLNELNKLIEGLGYQIIVSGQFGEFEHGHNERLFLKARKL